MERLAHFIFHSAVLTLWVVLWVLVRYGMIHATQGKTKCNTSVEESASVPCLIKTMAREICFIDFPGLPTLYAIYEEAKSEMTLCCLKLIVCFASRHA